MISNKTTPKNVAKCHHLSSFVIICHHLSSFVIICHHFAAFNFPLLTAPASLLRGIKSEHT
ncbi:MAG: hypothetical protein A3H92_11745 [Rhodospirillales bacterium RIFCSPLOWO2_02_FULL_58_16]|nr:MAG: hypothetical protein A3H92_11745 [Rhodospirillales bacterium RIFCSPLOWO2_02_FULL_58_16]